MKKATHWVTFLLLSIFSLSTFAASEIYKSTDEKGIVTYSDQPNAQSETVTLQRENISKLPPKLTNSTDGTDAIDAEKREEYTNFAISSPKDQDTFQNATEIPVSVNISPALQKGDTIEFYLDGTSVDKASTSTSISIPKMRGDKEIITRGSHTVSASLFNAAGDVLKTTASVTLFVHYASVNSATKKP